MDLDLARALHDAAERGTAHLGDLDTAPVLHRIRRRRAVRHAVEGTVGVAAVGAVAVGAAQVTALRDAARVEPVAPATSTPTPSPSPTTPAPAPADVPVVRMPDPVECDVALPRVVDPDGDADLRFAPSLTVGAPAGERAGVSVVVGDQLTVDARLVNGTGGRVEATAAGPVEVWFTRDGSVAGGLSPVSGGGLLAQYSLGPGEDVAGAPLVGPAVACSSEGADPLPPGAYELVLVQELRLAGGGAVRVTGAPVPVEVVAADAGTTDPHPDLADLAVSPTGLGPLAVGVAPAANPGAAMIAFDPVRCEGLADPPGRWVASGYPEDVVDGQPRDPFFVDADDDAVRRIDVLGTTIRTAEGVGVGTPLTNLQATYPQLEGPFEGPLSRVWWLTSDTGTLVFETQSDADGLQPAGTPETVILLRVLAAGVDPAFAAANSDNIAGGCL